MSSLTEIADVALIHILERCSFSSVMRLRKVCKSLRKFIDESHLETDLKYAAISISPALFQFRWCTKLPPEDNEFENDDITSEELRTILSIQNSKLCTLEVSVHRQPELLADLEDILKAKRRSLQVEKLVMGAIDVSEFMKVLSHMDSDVLKTIHLFSTGWGKIILNGMEELLEIEQIKNAKEFKLVDFMVEKDLCKFFHFEACDINFDKLAEKDLVALKEAFTTSTHMRKFILQATNLDGNMAEKVFGEPLSESAEINGVVRDVKSWYFQMKNCKEHVLQMGCYKKTIGLFKRQKSTISNKEIVFEE
ncbi:unnamed protein product [Caenorhabditis brenneri]